MSECIDPQVLNLAAEMSRSLPERHSYPHNFVAKLPLPGGFIDGKVICDKFEGGVLMSADLKILGIACRVYSGGEPEFALVASKFTSATD